MGKRRRKGKGRAGKKAIPLLLLAPVMPGIMTAYGARGSGPVAAVRAGIGKTTGIDIMGEVGFQQSAALQTLGLVIAGMIGHKVANKVGINRQLKKISFGWVQL
jgi:hypothetical protein